MTQNIYYKRFVVMACVMAGIFFIAATAAFAQSRVTLNLAYDQKATGEARVQNNYSLGIEATLKNEGGQDKLYLVFERRQPRIAVNGFENFWIFDQKTTLRELASGIQNTIERFVVPRNIQIETFFSTPQQPGLLALERGFRNKFYRFASNTGANIPPLVFKGSLPTTFTLELSVYHGPENAVQDRLQSIIVNMVLPVAEPVVTATPAAPEQTMASQQTQTAAQTPSAPQQPAASVSAQNDCERLKREFLAKYEGLRPPVPYEGLERMYISEMASVNLAGVRHTQNNLRNYISSIQELITLKNQIEADQTFRGCQEIRADILNPINTHINHERSLLTFIDKLNEHAEHLEACEDEIKTERTRIEALSVNLNRALNTFNANQMRSKSQELVSLAEKESNMQRLEQIKVNLDTESKNVSGHIRTLTALDAEARAVSSMLAQKNSSGCEDQVTALVNQLRAIITRIQNNIRTLDGVNEFIARGLTIADPERQRRIDELRSSFRPQLQAMLDSMKYAQTRVEELRDAFNEKRSAESYYARDKKQLQLSINEEIATLQSLKDRADRLLKSLARRADMSNVGEYRTANIANELEDNLLLVGADASDELFMLQRAIDDYKYVTSFPYAVVAIVLVSAIIIIFGLIVNYKAVRRRKAPHNEEAPVSRTKKNALSTKMAEAELLGNGESAQKANLSASVGGVTIRPKYSSGDKSELVNKGRGLGHAYNEVGQTYFQIDLADIWDDTMVRKVLIHRSCIKKTYKFFYESCVADGKVLETGGYMIGGWDYNQDEPGKFDISLEDFIEPGDDAIYGEYQLNFGAKIGIRLDKVAKDYQEKTGRELLLLAWFHSHPAIKIFLSNHDLDVQDRLISEVHKSKLLAFVIDPITQENGKILFSTGIFSYKSTGVMNNNDGSMQLISWKDMYSWALTPPMPKLDEYFKLDMRPLQKDTPIETIYWNDRSIIRFSLFLDESIGTEKYTAYFRGKVIYNPVDKVKIAIINDFVSSAEVLSGLDEDVIAYFCCCGKQSEVIKDVQKNQDMKNVHIVMFCKGSDKDLYFLIRDQEHPFPTELKFNRSLPFTELESWPTRTR